MDHSKDKTKTSPEPAEASPGQHQHSQQLSPNQQPESPTAYEARKPFELGQQQQQPPPQQQPQQPQLKEYKVVVPEGVAPGQTFYIHTPDNMQFMVPVPPNTSAGQTMSIQLPVAYQPSPSATGAQLEPSPQALPNAPPLASQSSIAQPHPVTPEPESQKFVTRSDSESGRFQENALSSFRQRGEQDTASDPGTQHATPPANTSIAQPQSEVGEQPSEPPRVKTIIQAPPFRPSSTSESSQPDMTPQTQQQPQPSIPSRSQSDESNRSQLPMQQQNVPPTKEPTGEQESRPNHLEVVQLTPFLSWDVFTGAPYRPVPLGTRPAIVHDVSTTQIIPTGRKKAFVVGVNYFKSKAELYGSVNDARVMQSFLLRHGFPNTPTTMLVMTDDQTDENFIPTYANMLRGLQWLVQGAAPGDALFFHFSGHGAQQPDLSGVDKDGLNETLLPMDFQYSGHISDDMLWDTLVNPLPCGCKLTVVLDCCYCGTGIDLPFSWQSQMGWSEEVNPNHAEGDVRVFAGFEELPYATDTYDRFATGGAITTAFITAMEAEPGTNHPSLVASMQRNLLSRGFVLGVAVSSSQRFDVHDTPVELVTHAIPNTNPTVGKIKRRNFRSGEPRFRGTVLADLLPGPTHPIPIPSHLSGFIASQGPVANAF